MLNLSTNQHVSCLQSSFTVFSASLLYIHFNWETLRCQSRNQEKSRSVSLKGSHTFVSQSTPDSGIRWMKGNSRSETKKYLFCYQQSLYSFHWEGVKEGRFGCSLPHNIPPNRINHRHTHCRSVCVFAWRVCATCVCTCLFVCMCVCVCRDRVWEAGEREQTGSSS